MSSNILDRRSRHQRPDEQEPRDASENGSPRQHVAIPTATIRIDWNNWSPRTSFAYGVKGDGRSVVRGGYGGIGGAYGPEFTQFDIRLGHRTRWSVRQTLDIFFDVFNVTNHGNFNNPSGDMRSSNFLNLTSPRAGSGFPRQAHFGIRWGLLAAADGGGRKTHAGPGRAADAVRPDLRTVNSAEAGNRDAADLAATGRLIESSCGVGLRPTRGIGLDRGPTRILRLPGTRTIRRFPLNHP